MVGVNIGIFRPSQGDMPDIPQRAGFGGFYYDSASNLLAYLVTLDTVPLTLL
jgi:hypothetical protein